MYECLVLVGACTGTVAAAAWIIGSASEPARHPAVEPWAPVSYTSRARRCAAALSVVVLASRSAWLMASM